MQSVVYDIETARAWATLGTCPPGVGCWGLRQGGMATEALGLQLRHMRLSTATAFSRKKEEKKEEKEKEKERKEKERNVDGRFKAPNSI